MFNGNDGGSIAYYNWFAYEFWRFVFAQQQVAQAAQSFIDFPPMQGGASFIIAAIKEQIEKACATPPRPVDRIAELTPALLGPRPVSQRRCLVPGDYFLRNCQ